MGELLQSNLSTQTVLGPITFPGGVPYEVVDLIHPGAPNGIGRDNPYSQQGSETITTAIRPAGEYLSEEGPELILKLSPGSSIIFAILKLQPDKPYVKPDVTADDYQPHPMDTSPILADGEYIKQVNVDYIHLPPNARVYLKINDKKYMVHTWQSNGISGGTNQSGASIIMAYGLYRETTANGSWYRYLMSGPQVQVSGKNSSADESSYVDVGQSGIKAFFHMNS